MAVPESRSPIDGEASTTTYIWPLRSFVFCWKGNLPCSTVFIEDYSPSSCLIEQYVHTTGYTYVNLSHVLRLLCQPTLHSYLPSAQWWADCCPLSPTSCSPGPQTARCGPLPLSLPLPLPLPLPTSCSPGPQMSHCPLSPPSPPPSPPSPLPPPLPPSPSPGAAPRASDGSLCTDWPCPPPTVTVERRLCLQLSDRLSRCVDNSRLSCYIHLLMVWS